MAQFISTSSSFPLSRNPEPFSIHEAQEYTLSDGIVKVYDLTVGKIGNQVPCTTPNCDCVSGSNVTLNATPVQGLHFSRKGGTEYVILKNKSNSLVEIFEKKIAGIGGEYSYTVNLNFYIYSTIVDAKRACLLCGENHPFHTSGFLFVPIEILPHLRKNTSTVSAI